MMVRRINLFIVIIIVFVVISLTVGTYLWINSYLEAKVKANTQYYISQINELQNLIKEYKKNYVMILKIKNRYKSSLQEIIEMLYNRRSSIGGELPNAIPDSDEAILLELRDIVYSMEDEQKMLDQVKKFLSSRKKYIDSFPFIWPVKTGGIPQITSGFGFRKDVFGKDELHFHAGIDIAGYYGEPIIATADGIVKYIDSNHKLYGKLVIIEHKYGFETYYGHLSAINVRMKQKVKRGQVIGKMGNSGVSLGVHLHYEIRKDDIPINPMDLLTTQF